MRTLLVLTMCLAACGGGDDDFEAPTCGDNEFKLEGSIDDTPISEVRSDYASYVFVNKIGEDLGQLDVTFADDDTLSLRFPDLVANGDSVEARGGLAFIEASLILGNCEDDGFPGILRMDDDGDGGTFLLTSLHRGGVPCNGGLVDGELTGCFRSPP